MNKIVFALVVAFAGVAAASLLRAWRELEAKSLEKEDIRRWEDEGGKDPAMHEAGPGAARAAWRGEVV